MSMTVGVYSMNDQTYSPRIGFKGLKVTKPNLAKHRKRMENLTHFFSDPIFSFLEVY